MPVIYQGRCSACKLSKIDKQLKRRIFQSSYFSDKGIEPLAQIQKDYADAFSYMALLRHCRKHVKFTQKEQNALEAKWNNNQVVTNVIKTQPTPVAVKPGREDEVFNDIIDAGMEKLKNGELKITTDHLIRAADSKANLSLKRKDQELKIQEMIWHFASGEAEGNIAYEQRIIEGEAATDYDATAITAENVDRGTTRPGPLY